MVMSAADLDTKTEDEPKAASEPGVRLSWDGSVGATPLDTGWDAEPVVVDWSGRGAPDLLVTAGGGPLGRTARLYRPLSARGCFPPVYDAGTRIEALDGLRCLCPIPNGAPSRFDLVALDRAGLVLLRNQGDAAQPAFGPRQPLDVAPELGLGTCRVVQVVPVDWDGDGLLDLLAGVDDLQAYWPDSPALPPAQQVGFNQKGGHPGYDRQGKWRGRGPRGLLVWLRNVGTIGDPVFALQPEIGGEAGPLDLALHPAPLALAWGGGASLELLVTDARGQVRIHRNFGGQRPPVLMEPRTLHAAGAPLLLPEDRTALVAADLDDDRRVELIYATSDGRVFAVHAGSTRGEVQPPVPILHESDVLWLGGHAVLAVGDLDGDGDLDLVVGDAPGRLWLFRDQGEHGDHRYAAAVPLEAGGLPFRVDPGPDGMRDGPVARRLGFAGPTLVDWTGNGRPDLLVGTAGGDVLFLRNDGAATDPRFGAPCPLRCLGAPLIVPPRVRPAAADWYGAGQLDLIALDLQGLLCVYPRTETLDLGPPVPLVDRLGRYLRLDGSFGQAGGCALWAGPWTGSGRIDILIGLPRGNRHVVPALTGLPLDRLDDLPTVLLLENQGQGVLVPRPIRHGDGRPVIVGAEGCSPCGVAGSEAGTLDLLIGSDDGRITLLGRGDLRW
jgi:hypothetical protein